MKKVCAWCKKEIEPDESAAAGQNAPISHGVCPECVPKFFSFMGKPMRDFLDEFSEPVFLVDATNRIISANGEGLGLLHKEPAEIEEKMAGDVFECPNAEEGEGCGKTIHCKACTIRNAVIDTAQTGEARLHIPAYADVHWFSKDKRAKFSISTEKVGQAVLLRVEDVP